MAIDLNQILAPQVPVTCIVTGNLSGLFALHETFENNVAGQLAALTLPIASVSISWSSPVGSAFSAEIVARTTNEVRTAAGVAYQVGQAVQNAAGVPVSASTVTKIGSAGEVVTPAAPGLSLLDRLFQNVEDLGKILKWAAVLVVVGLVVWLLVESGAFTAVRSAIA